MSSLYEEMRESGSETSSTLFGRRKKRRDEKREGGIDGMRWSTYFSYSKESLQWSIHEKKVSP